jgi:hypothetical protein
MKTPIELIYINISIIYIIEISGFVDAAKRIIWNVVFPKIRYQHFTAKPFDCSFCLTFWFTLFYLWRYENENFALSLCFASGVSFVAPFITKLLNYIRWKLL